MTDPEMWMAVGRALAVRREELGFRYTKTLSKAKGGRPNEVTMNAIEAGRPGNVASLSDYCDVLGLRLAEVLAGVLPTAAVPAESLRVLRGFDAAPPLVQKAVRLMLEAVPAPPAPPRPEGNGPVTHAKTGARSGRR